VGVSADVHTATDVQSDIGVYTTGCFKFASTAIAQTDVGAPMFVTDNETIDPASAQFICCGKLTHRDSATVGWVDIGQAAVLTTAATGITFADGGAYVHFAALAAANVDAALEEDHLDLDQHACADGAGAVATSPSANREHFAAAVEADGRGIAYLVQAAVAGVNALTVVAPTDQVAGLVNAIPEVTMALNTTGTQPSKFYAPDAIVGSNYGWVYKVYTQVNSGLATNAGAAIGDPVWNGVAGALTLTQPTGTNRCQVVGRVLTLEPDGEVQIDFDDWNFYPHYHNSDACGGEIGQWIHFFFDAAINAGGGATVLTLPLWELPYDIEIRRCYASLDTACGGAVTLALTVNANALVTFTGAEVQQENEALAVAIGADTDIIFSTNQGGGGIAADLHVSVYYVRT
jgi:hypothetical protein